MKKRIPPYERIFQAFDLHASFKEGLQGHAVQRVVDFDGVERLDRTVWEAGLQAYNFLKDNSEDGITREGFGRWVASAKTFLSDDFYPDFLQLVEAGRVSFSDGTADDFYEAWKSYDWVQRFDVFLGMLDHARNRGAGESSELDFFKSYVAAAVLQRIDDAVMSEIFDGSGLVENVVDIVGLHARLKPQTQQRMTIDAVMGAARKEIGKAGAAAKLARDPKQVEKVAVRECWNAWQRERARYKSVAAFARDMLQKFENLESQQVIERWCRTWAKETQLAE